MVGLTYVRHRCYGVGLSTAYLFRKLACFYIFANPFVC